MSKKICDITSESLFIGSLYSNPDKFIEYEPQMRSQYDFYNEDYENDAQNSESVTKFFYDCFDLYYKTFSQDINEQKLNMFMSQNEERLKQYKKFRGWNTIHQLMNMSDSNDIKKYFQIVKKFSLLREFDRKGFPVEKIMNYKNFDSLKPEDIVRIMRRNVDIIHTAIGGGEESIKIANKMEAQIEKWCDEPDMGIELPYMGWTTSFRGWRLKKLIIDFMLSNQGKTRQASLIAAYTAFVLDEKVLMMCNESDEEEIMASMLVCVCNNPLFGFELNIPEDNIVLGEYEDLEQKNKVKEVVKYMKKRENNLFFKEMPKYGDTDIEREIKKHVLGLNVKYIIYDTLKGYLCDDWGAVKQTATLLKGLAMELKIGIYVTMQLTDDSINMDIEDLTSLNIANAKQVYHVADFIIMEKELPRNKYNKYKIKSMADDSGWGEISLDPTKTYYGGKVVKSRSGGKHIYVKEVDLAKNVWKEVGILVY